MHPLLEYPNFSKPFTLTTNASNTDIGAVFLPGTPNTEKPISFANHTIADIDLNYSIVEKEIICDNYYCDVRETMKYDRQPHKLQPFQYK